MMPWLPCREFVQFLDDYIDGTMEAPRRLAFDDHLSRCPSCANYIATYRQASELARKVLSPGDQAVPDSVPEELVRAILRLRDR